MCMLAVLAAVLVLYFRLQTVIVRSIYIMHVDSYIRPRVRGQSWKVLRQTLHPHFAIVYVRRLMPLIYSERRIMEPRAHVVVARDRAQRWIGRAPEAIANPTRARLRSRAHRKTADADRRRRRHCHYSAHQEGGVGARARGPHDNGRAGGRSARPKMESLGLFSRSQHAIKITRERMHVQTAEHSAQHVSTPVRTNTHIARPRMEAH
jgi:hypothetical protein